MISVRRDGLTKGLEAVAKISAGKPKGDAFLTAPDGFLEISFGTQSVSIKVSGQWAGKTRFPLGRLLKLRTKLPKKDALQVVLGSDYFEIETLKLFAPKEDDPGEEDVFCIEELLNVCSQLDLCCVDNEPVGGAPDGTYDACVIATDISGDLNINEDDCDIIGYDFVSGACKYIENDWVFNIADFVNVLFSIDKNKDVYNVQIRFYPLPLNQGEEE